MRRPTSMLSAAQVKSRLTPGKHFDGFGLYLRVAPNGSRQWVQRITVRGKRRELGLGSPPIVTLAHARTAAIENHRLARDGRDPVAEKRRSKAILSFEEAARRVHELHKPNWRSEKHADDFINSLQTYAFPVVGRLRTPDVSSADVLAVLAPIWTTKPETARRVRQRIGTVLKWAKAQGWRSDNPADDIGQALPKHDRVRTHRRALPYAEVGRCLNKVKASNAWPATKLALEFLVLTASRSGEVRGAKWAEISGFDNGRTEVIWNLPAERMKAKRAHRVPLSQRAVEILAVAESFKDETGLIFPSARAKALSDMTLSKLVKELGFNADVHGFRTSFRTWVQEQTVFQREVAEAALAHSVGDAVEAAYARSDLFEKRRQLMIAWSEFVGQPSAQPR